jgi:hypothetical protein
VSCPQRPPPDGDHFFQTLKHGRVSVQALLLYCSVTAYLHQQMSCHRDVTAIKNHPGMGGFPDRQTNFPNLGYPVLRITAPQKCDASAFFVKCQNSMGNTQAMFLILLAGDVDADKVLRRYRGLDLEVKGFVKGAKGSFKCSLSLACEVCVYANF